MLNAASFAVSAVALARLRLPRPPAPVGPGRWRQQLVDGAHLLTRVLLRRLPGRCQLLAALSAGATSALLVILAARRLHVAADGFWLLLAASGVGAALGPSSWPG